MTAAICGDSLWERRLEGCTCKHALYLTWPSWRDSFLIHPSLFRRQDGVHLSRVKSSIFSSRTEIGVAHDIQVFRLVHTLSHWGGGMAQCQELWIVCIVNEWCTHNREAETLSFFAFSNIVHRGCDPCKANSHPSVSVVQPWQHSAKLYHTTFCCQDVSCTICSP